MGKRGPAPTPTRIKELKGNPGQRKLNKSEPIPVVGEPVCPAFLDDAGQVEFERICDELRGMGLLHSADTGIIACLADSWADFNEYKQAISDKGRYSTRIGKDGCSAEVPDPWIRLKREAKQEILKFSVELGLTPSARSRIQISEKTEGDEMENYLTGNVPKPNSKDKHVH